jgi:putative membrane protein
MQDPPAPGGDQVGARIRTHLANERTFLAWFRTGLTSIALGAAVAQLLDAGELFGIEAVKLLACMLVAFGGMIVLLGHWRYRVTARAIDREELHVQHRQLEVAVVAALVVAVVSLLVVLR